MKDFVDYQYQTPWPTPTPYPTADATPRLELGVGIDQHTSEQIVQGYQTLDNLIDLSFLWFVAFLVVVLGGVWSIIRHVQRIRN